MKKGLEIIGFWVLWTIILFICILCLFGISLLDDYWPYLCTLGAVASAYALILLMNDNNETTYYDR